MIHIKDSNFAYEKAVHLQDSTFIEKIYKDEIDYEIILIDVGLAWQICLAGESKVISNKGNNQYRAPEFRFHLDDQADYYVPTHTKCDVWSLI